VVILLLALTGVTGFLSLQLFALNKGVDSPPFEFVADIDDWQATDRQRTVQARYDFRLGPHLHQIPLQIRDWRGTDIPQTNLEVFILLEPEEYVYRQYALPDGRFVWLSLIGSRKSKSFHPPQICYAADGWQTSMSSEPIPLAKGELYALMLEATKSGNRHLVLYFFLWPDARRDIQAGEVMFKVTSPLWGTKEETLELQKSFIREFFASAKASG